MKQTRRETQKISCWPALAVICALALIYSVAGAQVAQNPRAEGGRWWKDVSFLAGDDLQGRMTGSGGYQAAAGYVAGRFKDEGLTEAGTVGFFQPVKFKSLELDEAYSSVELIHGSDTTELTLGKEVILSPTGDSGGEITTDAVFVGYGISAPEANYNDFAGLDLRGKIAVYLAGGPDTIKDPLRAHEESSGERWKAMKAAGAIGSAAIFNPVNQEVPWERIAGNRRRPALQLAEASLRRDQGREISLSINPEDADVFFAGSGHTMAEILADAKGKQPLPKFPLAVRIHAKVKVNETDMESPNVVGELEGSDPVLKKQFVVVSAHLDHLGIGAPVNGDDIYNGAMDNAAGVAALIQIARDFRESKAKPKRSVIFLALCGEEEGELGSWYFANHPSVPAEGIVADINMDMFLPLFPLEYLQVQGLDESTLGGDIRAAGLADSVKVIADEQPEANRFIRSDQYSFVQNGIPALAFKFGYEKGSPQEKTFNDWVHTHYHEPSDDTYQKVDQEAAGKFCYLIYMLADRVADDPARPTWEPTSFFRRFAAK
ncbi:MAG: M20/M25/M40 family metallo-hydrolase [Candidatus Acidiferrales bacterium]